MKTMQATVPVENRTRQAGAEWRGDAGWLLDERPDARDAIRRRLAQFPEYRTWLEQSGNGVLRAVENDG